MGHADERLSLHYPWSVSVFLMGRVRRHRYAATNPTEIRRASKASFESFQMLELIHQVISELNDDSKRDYESMYRQVEGNSATEKISEQSQASP